MRLIAARRRVRHKLLSGLSGGGGGAEIRWEQRSRGELTRGRVRNEIADDGEHGQLAELVLPLSNLPSL